MFKHSYIIFLLSFFEISVNAQSVQFDRFVIASSGKFVSTSSIQLSFTIGQASPVNTVTSGNIQLLQGFQQVSGTGVGINELNIPFNSITVYPNPVTKNILINIEYQNQFNLKLELFNLMGQSIQNFVAKDLQSNKQTIINLDQNINGLYFLQITVEDKGKFFKTIRKISIIN